MGSLKEAQDELATSFVNSNNFLANLDDTSDDYYETLLKQMGVENADTIVKNELAKKKGLEAIETADLTNMTSDEIAKLIEEKAKTDQARNAMKLFALEKVYANGKALDTTEDINQLINLMDSLGLSTNKSPRPKPKIPLTIQIKIKPKRQRQRLTGSPAVSPECSPLLTIRLLNFRICSA